MREWSERWLGIPKRLRERSEGWRERSGRLRESGERLLDLEEFLHLQFGWKSLLHCPLSLAALK